MSEIPEWRAAAVAALEYLRIYHDDFTTDDLIERLEERGGEMPPNLMLLGSVLQSAAHHGLIEKTGKVRRSRIPRRHRDLTIWRST